MRQTPPSYMDLVDYLIDYGHAKTKREANNLLIEGRIKCDSHIVGRESCIINGKVAWRPAPRVPAAYKPDLWVV